MRTGSPWQVPIARDQGAVTGGHAIEHPVARGLLQQRQRGDLEDVVRTGAQRDPVHRHAVAFRLGRLQVETVGVGIAGQRLGRGQHGRARRLGHAQRVFIGRQLDDAGRIQPELAGQFFNGLARLVGRDGADVRGSNEGLGCGGHGVEAHGAG
ncbi:hypothetical protein G6F50_016335 [Rhizopus delemar]|uniref:Uncharacterized protein n=1 Tax=Rhizopus delemar TaxID=936053 RepID=A0A9P6XU19_9FUNG|nr:hypothetical protein G6F50_016335 [Rhizopus delemar]